MHVPGSKHQPLAIQISLVLGSSLGIYTWSNKWPRCFWCRCSIILRNAVLIPSFPNLPDRKNQLWSLDSQALPLVIQIPKLRQVWETLGIFFPWQCIRLRADFYRPISQRLYLVSVDGDGLLENISYHCIDQGLATLGLSVKGWFRGGLAKAQSV